MDSPFHGRLDRFSFLMVAKKAAVNIHKRSHLAWSLPGAGGGRGAVPGHTERAHPTLSEAAKCFPKVNGLTLNPDQQYLQTALGSVRFLFCFSHSNGY